MICLKLKSRILGWDLYASIQGKLTASWTCSPGKCVHFGTPNSLLRNLSLRITPPLPSKSMTSATKITGCSGQTWALKLGVLFANASNTPRVNMFQRNIIGFLFDFPDSAKAALCRIGLSNKNSASSATSNSLYKQLETSFSESCTRLLVHAIFLEAPKRPARLHWLTPRCFMSGLGVWCYRYMYIYKYI